MKRIIAVTGGKGGVGKTNISLNLALMISKLGLRACLFDADLGLANINILLGINPEWTLYDVISNNKQIQDVLIKGYHGIDILPGSSGIEKIAELKKNEINKLIHSFSELTPYDYYIFDTSAGISKSVIAFCMASSEIIVVITPEPTSITDAYALLKILNFNKYQGIPRVVVNQCKNLDFANQAYSKLKKVVDKFLSINISPLGVVVHDESVQLAVRSQEPFSLCFPNSKASKCIESIALRLEKSKPDGITELDFSDFLPKFLGVLDRPIKLNSKTEIKNNGFDDKQECDRKDEFIKKLVISELPTLPQILIKLIDVLNNEETALNDLAVIIEKDPSLYLKILRLVNSAYYSLPQEIKNLTQALSYLGIDTIRNLVLTASVFQVFDSDFENHGFNLKLFWRHSLTCAVLSSAISKKTGLNTPEEAFLAGILHDFGRLVLIKNYPEEYPRLLASLDKNVDISSEEHELLGINHCEAASILIRHWRLKSFIADAVKYHHEPSYRIKNSLPLVQTVYVSNIFCSDNPDQRDKGLKLAEDIFGINSMDMELILDQAFDQVKKIAHTLDIDIEDPGNEKEEQVKIKLSHHVRDVSLLHGAYQNMINATDLDSILKVAHQSIQILFEKDNIMFFLYDDEQKLLTGKSFSQGINQDLAEGLTVRFFENKSILILSIVQNKIVSSFSDVFKNESTIIDEQLIQLMGVEGIICFPMIVKNEKIGSVVFGLDEPELQQVNNNMNLFSMFIDNLGFILAAENARKVRQKLILAERLAASSAMAKRVAHEVNNPLSIIKNYLKIHELNLSDKNLPTDEIKIINNEIDRVASIIGELSDLSNARVRTLEPVDINKLLKELTVLSNQSFMIQNININTRFDEKIPVINTDKNGLKQVFVNLLKNASEAIGSDGNINIETRYSEKKDSLIISIEDDGPGVPEIVRGRLFEPYASSKGNNHTGLGLSIVYNIINALKGSITCDSEKGKKTIFKITLPVKN